MRFRASVALMLIAMPAGFSGAQNPPPPRQPTPFISTRSTLVLVPTLVKTRAGELVYTLTADDFTITDNGVPQKVTLEEDTGDQPLALVVAVETGGAGARQLDKYRNLGTMIESVVGDVRHRLAVVTFDSEPALLQNFTSDLSVMDDTLQGLSPGDGGAAILDGIAFSVNLLRKQPAEYRRAILLLSETVDHGSHARLEDALHVISDTNTAIYSMAFSTSKAEMKHEGSRMFSDSTPGPAGGCMSKDPAAATDPTGNRFAQAWDCLSLLAPPLRAAKMAALLGINGLRHNVPETVAHLTGGEYFHFSNRRDLERSLATISNHVPNRYVLSFHPQSPQPGLHAIELQLKDHPDLVVTARNSYWANSDTASIPRRP